MTSCDLKKALISDAKALQTWGITPLARIMDFWGLIGQKGTNKNSPD